VIGGIGNCEVEVLGIHILEIYSGLRSLNFRMLGWVLYKNVQFAAFVRSPSLISGLIPPGARV
jgi:hypothetical protein